MISCAPHLESRATLSGEADKGPRRRLLGQRLRGSSFMARVKSSAAYVASAVAATRATAGRMSTATGRCPDAIPPTSGLTLPPAKMEATATTWHRRFMMSLREGVRRPRSTWINGGCTRCPATSGPDWKFNETVAETVR